MPLTLGLSLPLGLQLFRVVLSTTVIPLCGSNETDTCTTALGECFFHLLGITFLEGCWVGPLFLPVGLKGGSSLQSPLSKP